MSRDAGQVLPAGRWNEPALVRLYARAVGLEQMLGLPKLARPSLAKFVERSHADHRFQFLSRRSDSMKEIRQ